MPTLADILNTLFAFILTGIIGAFIQRWFSRAIPKFIITSVGFHGSNNLIKVPEKAVIISLESGWLDTLMPYASFSELMTQHKAAIEIIQKLQKTVEMADEWLEKESKGNDVLSIAELKSNICLTQQTVTVSIFGMIRRGELSDPPTNLAELQKMPKITQLSVINEKDVTGWSLFLGIRNVIFPTERLRDDERQQGMELCAESFARGHRKNIAYYTRNFVNSSNNGLRKLVEFQQTLEEVLLPEARLFVELSIYNSGQFAVAIRPHMGLKILHTDFDKKPFILSVQKQTDNMQALQSQTKQKSRIGKEVIAESFLPETSINSYVSIPPGEMRDVSLIASQPLGKVDGERIKKIYQTGVLNCKVVGQTLDGKKVWSSPATFSNDITPEDKAELEKIAIDGFRWP